MVRRFSVLWVAAPTDPLPRFLQDLDESGIDITRAQSCDEARRRLAGSGRFGLVVSAAHLSDGNWYSVLSSLVHRGADSGFVVVANEVNESFRQRVRDHGGIDAIELGAAMGSAGAVSRAMLAASS